MVVDISKTIIDGQCADQLVTDQWAKGFLQDHVSGRGGEIIKETGRSSTVSVANAICDHMHNWYKGTKEGDWTTMGIIPEEPILGIDNSIFFSYPVTIDSDGEIKIVDNFEHDEITKQKIRTTENQLLEEKSMVE